MVKAIRTSGKKTKTLWREGYPKYRIEEVWGKKGLIGANYYSKKTGFLVKSKRAIKGKRTEW